MLKATGRLDVVLGRKGNNGFEPKRSTLNTGMIRLQHYLMPGKCAPMQEFASN